MEYRIPPGTEAVEKLEDFIVVNRLAPNTRIPSERDLCEMWGVSRTTLRQAVDTLVGRGVLYRVNGAGVYVSVGKKNRKTETISNQRTPQGGNGYEKNRNTNKRRRRTWNERRHKSAN